ncbi:DNA polymerase IV [Salibacterium halotolerans]|uniref:DNA polymerase IV n=1 Tax=Salibacterium halotolerans TaxID=1884432 RepID=A0A1I5TEQ4_9BACI|nr:DNA polymerase IV [Salibacterium halotolerans]SFP80906.1 DNA polymerase-4/DNA polymerase V [Salibacterium halotolerans]
MERTIFLVDMQSFYASLEKVFRPDLEEQPVVVAGDPDIRSGVILAACPEAKKWGVQTAEALWEAENKCPHLTVIKPRMQLYLDASVEIAAVFEAVSNQVEPYSVDEIFVEMTHVLRPDESPEEAARLLKRQVKRMLGVNARVGIGPTKVLAKMACDHFAKKTPGEMFTLSDANLQQQLWPRPVGDLFGVGSRMEKHLRNMGIRTIGQLAAFPLEQLQKRWGINGELIWHTAYGRDSSPVTTDTHVHRKGIGHHMTLARDYYSWEEIRVVLRELSEEVARRVRADGCMGCTVSAGAGGHDFDYPAGFHRQEKLMDYTNDGTVIYETVCRLFREHWTGFPLRSVGITLDQLVPDTFRQLSLFSPLQDKESLNHTIDHLKQRFGSAAVLHASSLTQAGQALLRAQKIGGHYK